jgi:hypothetical protein
VLVIRDDIVESTRTNGAALREVRVREKFRQYGGAKNARLCWENSARCE